MEIRFEEIKSLVPQRYPFLMVDRVLSLEQGERAVAIKNVTGNELFFTGHFPNMAVMPGALIMESLAQTAIILFRKSYELFRKSYETDSEIKVNDKVYVFGGVTARFLNPVVPGDQLQLEVRMIKAISDGGVVEGKATVDGEKVATATLTFGVKRVEDLLST